jgi:hypothetical protein
VKDTILIGKNEGIYEESAADWRHQLAAVDERMKPRLSFMTPDHHLVRYAAVRELPRRSGKPLSPDDLAAVTNLSVLRVSEILEELEKNLFFLVRDETGSVSWAFPVTSDSTPHRLTFSTGEHSFAA